MAVDFLDEKRNEIAARLEELRPLIGEYQRLEAAIAALDGVSPPAARTGPPRGAKARSTSAGKPRRSAPARGSGRPVGSGKRAVEALALVTATPGITVPEIAEKIGINQNYLYRVLPSLAAKGLVVKHGRGWHPAPTSETLPTTT